MTPGFQTNNFNFHLVNSIQTKSWDCNSPPTVWVYCHLQSQGIEVCKCWVNIQLLIAELTLSCYWREALMWWAQMPVTKCWNMPWRKDGIEERRLPLTNGVSRFFLNIYHIYSITSRASNRSLPPLQAGSTWIHGPCLGGGQGDMSSPCFWGWGTKGTLSPPCFTDQDFLISA